MILKVWSLNQQQQQRHLLEMNIDRHSPELLNHKLLASTLKICLTFLLILMYTDVSRTTAIDYNG